jgi:hypothetical protein
VPGDAMKGTLFLIRHPQNYDIPGTSCRDDEMLTVRFGTLKYRVFSFNVSDHFREIEILIEI